MYHEETPPIFYPIDNPPWSVFSQLDLVMMMIDDIYYCALAAWPHLTVVGQLIDLSSRFPVPKPNF